MSTAHIVVALLVCLTFGLSGGGYVAWRWLGMTKRFLIMIQLLSLVIGVATGSYVAWRWVTRDHPAFGVYRMKFPEGMDFREGVTKVEQVMESEAVMARVVDNLGLVARFKVESDAEAKALVRERLSLRPLEEAGLVRVMYRDRSNAQALEILKKIHEEFSRTRAARAVLRPPGPQE